MGVREPRQDEIVAKMGRPRGRDRIKDGVRVLRTIGALMASHFALNRRIAEFYERLNSALAPPHNALEEMRIDELAAHYLDVARRRWTRWDAPRGNDFFAMIFHGLLRALAERWCGSRDGTLASDLVRGHSPREGTSMISAEPAERVRRMAALAAGDGEFSMIICLGTLVEIIRARERHPEFRSQYNSYVEKFGDRCLEELKLESPTLHDDPLLLFRSVGQIARSPSASARDSLPERSSGSNSKTHDQVRQAFGWHPLRPLLFQWMLGTASARVLQRENLRFERPPLFGRVRRIFVEIGRRLHALDLLEDPRDIFYLHVDEILAFIQGTASTTDLKALAALRQHEFASYKQSEPPGERFETHGIF